MRGEIREFAVRNNVRTILTIAGFDPSSGAGVTADLAVMAAHGCFGTSAITALTVQSTLGVAATYPVDPRIVAETLQHLAADLPPAGVKIGMLATGAIVEVVCEFLRGLPSGVPVVLDPVLRSSSGRELLDATGVAALRERLLPLATWVTPNRAELAVLAAGDVEVGARALVVRYPGLNAAVTGGDANADDFVRLADGRQEWLRGEKLRSNGTHGTGCAFSTALLCRVCDNDDGLPAALAAKQYVTEAIRRAPGIGGGKGPLDLLWPLR